MKKLLAIMFALVLMLSFAACGKDDDKGGNITLPTVGQQDITANQGTPVLPEITDADINIPVITDAAIDVVIPSTNEVADYVNANKAELLSSMEESFATSSGMTCTSSIEVIGNGFVIDININELTNVTEDQKAQLQSAYDSMGSTFNSALEMMQTEVPSLEYFTVNVCDAYGDVLAVVTAGA